MKNSLLFLFFVLMMSSDMSAQWSVGARFGGASGLSVKHYAQGAGLNIELIGARNYDENVDGTALTIMVQKFGALSENGKLGAFLGVGETMIFGDDFYLGISGALGFDWRIGRIGFQLDWLPTWIFINKSYFSPVNAAFTARWVFGG